MIKDYLRLAVTSLSHRKMRSWLTMIGIFIGITAVIAIVSLGWGLKAAVNDQFAELGSDKLFIQPGASAFGGATSVKLTEHDMRAIERTPGVSATIGAAFKNTRVERKDEQAFVLVMGVPTTSQNQDLFEVLQSDIVEGRGLEPGDTTKAVVGYDYLEDESVYERRLRLNDRILINNISFEVVGFREKIGNAVDDQQIIVSADGYRRVFGQQVEDDYMTIIVETAAGEDPIDVADRVKRSLRSERGLNEGDEDFTIRTAEQLMESFNTILNIVNVVIVGIAAISLVIGGIGIMNTMYTAVLERTNEIGIMKAIGARNSDVLLIFLIESGMLGFVGGLVGVLAGLGISKLVEIIGGAALGTAYLRAWWSWWLIGGALAFSFLAGAISGVAPAWQASRQKPVDSLRYE